LDLWTRQRGTPIPLGVSHIPEDDAYSFALYSKQANGVRLLLYRGCDSVLRCSHQQVRPDFVRRHIVHIR
jgi:hypothetical protein